MKFSIIDLFLTIFAYLIIPFFIFFKNNKKYTTIKFKWILLCNSIGIAFCFIAYRMYIGDENPVKTFAPAIIYYFINYFIWNKKVCSTESNAKKIYLK